MTTKIEWTTPDRFLKLHPKIISRTTLYQRLADGSLPCIKLGPRKILIPGDALERLLETPTTEQT